MLGGTNFVAGALGQAGSFRDADSVALGSYLADRFCGVLREAIQAGSAFFRLVLSDGSDTRLEPVYNKRSTTFA